MSLFSSGVCPSSSGMSTISSKRCRGRSRRNSMWVYDVHRVTNLILTLQARGVLKLEVPVSQLQLQVEEQLLSSDSGTCNDQPVLETLEDHELDQSEYSVQVKLGGDAVNLCDKENIPSENPISITAKPYSGKKVTTVLQKVDNIDQDHKLSENCPLQDAPKLPHEDMFPHTADSNSYQAIPSKPDEREEAVIDTQEEHSSRGIQNDSSIVVTDSLNQDSLVSDNVQEVSADKCIASSSPNHAINEDVSVSELGVDSSGNMNKENSIVNLFKAAEDTFHSDSTNVELKNELGVVQEAEGDSDVVHPSVVVQLASPGVETAATMPALSDAALDKDFLGEYIGDHSSSSLAITSVVSQSLSCTSPSFALTNDNSDSVQVVAEEYSSNQSPKMVELSSCSFKKDHHSTPLCQEDLVSKFSTIALSDKDSEMDESQEMTEECIQSSNIVSSEVVSESTVVNELKQSYGDSAAISRELQPCQESSDPPKPCLAVNCHSSMECEEKVEVSSSQMFHNSASIGEVVSSVDSLDRVELMQHSLNSCKESDLCGPASDHHTGMSLTSPLPVHVEFSETHQKPDQQEREVTSQVQENQRISTPEIITAVVSNETVLRPITKESPVIEDLTTVKSIMTELAEEEASTSTLTAPIVLKVDSLSDEQNVLSHTATNVSSVSESNTHTPTSSDVVIATEVLTNAEETETDSSSSNATHHSSLNASNSLVDKSSLQGSAECLTSEDERDVEELESLLSCTQQIPRKAVIEDDIEDKGEDAEETAASYVDFSAECSDIDETSAQSPTTILTSSEDESDVEKLEQFFESVSQSRMKPRVQKKKNRNPTQNLPLNVSSSPFDTSKHGNLTNSPLNEAEVSIFRPSDSQSLQTSAYDCNLQGDILDSTKSMDSQDQAKRASGSSCGSLDSFTNMKTPETPDYIEDNNFSIEQESTPCGAEDNQYDDIKVKLFDGELSTVQLSVELSSDQSLQHDLSISDQSLQRDLSISHSGKNVISSLHGNISSSTPHSNAATSNEALPNSFCIETDGLTNLSSDVKVESQDVLLPQNLGQNSSSNASFTNTEMVLESSGNESEVCTCSNSYYSARSSINSNGDSPITSSNFTESSFQSPERDCTSSEDEMDVEKLEQLFLSITKSRQKIKNHKMISNRCSMQNTQYHMDCSCKPDTSKSDLSHSDCLQPKAKSPVSSPDGETLHNSDCGHDQPVFTDFTKTTVSDSQTKELSYKSSEIESFMDIKTPEISDCVNGDISTNILLSVEQGSLSSGEDNLYDDIKVKLFDDESTESEVQVASVTQHSSPLLVVENDESVESTCKSDISKQSISLSIEVDHKAINECDGKLSTKDKEESIKDITAMEIFKGESSVEQSAYVGSPRHTPGVDITNSEDEHDTERLEKFFSLVTDVSRIKPRVKIEPKATVFDFIVSDTEEIDDGDERKREIHLEQTPTHYNTPHMPATGVVFWGSPNTHQKECVTSETGTKLLSHATPSNPRKYNITPFTGKKTRPFVSSHKDSAVDKKSISIRSGRKSLTGRKASHFSTPFQRPPLSLDVLTTPSSTKNFPRFKCDMVQELFQAFNTAIFDNKLPEDTEVIWNKKLRTTAGYCYYLGTYSSREARIELSYKVVDSYERLRSTLIHEMCHAATWIIDGVKGAGHGPVWKAWAQKVNKVYPGLEPVSACHGYQIQYRHYYKCMTCNFQIGRHSKSINLRTARCAVCGSYLEYVPRLKVDGTPMKARTPNKFAVFVKDNYSQVKSSSPWRSHKEIMEKIASLYSAHN